MQRVYATQDNDGHWYVIPYYSAARFSQLLELSEYGVYDDWEKYEEQFIEEFSQYMTGGDLNNVELFADV